MAKPEKVQLVEDIKDKVNSSESLFLTDYKGLTVSEISDLRRRLRAEGTEYHVLKNTLLKIALQDQNVDAINAHLEGPTAVAFAKENSPAIAKILNKYATETKKFTVKAGIMEGVFLDAAGVKTLANIPPREVLLAQLLGGMQATITKFVRVINNPVQNLVYALDAVSKTKE